MIIPGMIDIGTAIPAGKWDEAFETAAACGYTALLAAPLENTFYEELPEAEAAMEEPARNPRVDFARFGAVIPANCRSIEEWESAVPAIFLELGVLTEKIAFGQMTMLSRIFKAWPKGKPICVRGTAAQIGAALFMAQTNQKMIHVCSVSTREEIELIRESKENGTHVTCDIHPLNLLLCDQGNGRALPLRKVGTEDDRAALRENLGIIDCFSSANYLPLSGNIFDSLKMMPSLMEMLLMRGILDEAGIRARVAVNPRDIFGLYPQTDTAVEFEDTQLIAAITPDTEVVRSVRLRGEVIYEKGKPLPERFIGCRLKGYRG